MHEPYPKTCSKCKDRVGKYYILTQTGIEHVICNACCIQLMQRENGTGLNIKEGKQRRKWGEGAWIP